MDTGYDPSILEEHNKELFTIPSLMLDQSAALAACERMYANHRAGVRFYSDFRRVVSVAEMMAMSQAPDPQESADDIVLTEAELSAI